MANEEHLAVLRQGVEVWNEWREKNPEIKPNLRDSDLSGADLRWVNLRDSYLVKADFSKTDLRESDLSEADLSRANLNRANLSRADLFEADLSGADLSEAKLIMANLSGTRLIGANLCETNLSKVCLIRTQALETNFQRATLTGATIEDWNINSQTILDDVICDYVYLKPNKQERRPHDPNKNFAPGEFTKLFLHALETVDLIFKDGIDWQAFLTSFQALRVKKCGEGELPVIQAIENKDDGAFVIRVKVSPDANKAEIEKSFKVKYRRALKAREEQYRKLLQAKDKEIAIYRQQSADFMEIIRLQARRNIQNVIENQNLQGDRNMADNRTIHMGGGNYNERIEGDYIQGNYYAAGEKQNLAEAAAEIQALLEQLSKTYPADTTTGKMRLATEVIERIESNPTLMERILSALKAGSISALEQALNHPAASFVIGALEDWQQTKVGKEL